MMQIAEIEWRRYRLPFRRALTTAHGVARVREGALLRLRTDTGVVGIGEIAPLAEFGRERLSDALVGLPAFATSLRGLTLEAALDRLHPCASATAPAALQSPSLVFGVETALLDALGAVQGCSVAALLAAPSAVARDTVTVNAVLGAGTLDATVAAAQGAVADGYRCVKLKVGGQPIAADVARVAAVRAALGPDVALRLDANGGWTRDEAASVLTRCERYAIEYVEQPLAAGDLDGMRWLRQRVGVPVAADEALTGLASARQILDAGAADVLVLKPQCAGGLRACREIVRLAGERGAACVVTSAMEGGVGVAAAFHLAASHLALSRACGLATLDQLADDLIRPGLALAAGRMGLPGGAGLGVTLDEGALAQYTLDESWHRETV